VTQVRECLRPLNSIPVQKQNKGVCGGGGGKEPGKGISESQMK
jgi:hypothetical protein